MEGGRRRQTHLLRGDRARSDQLTSQPLSLRAVGREAPRGGGGSETLPGRPQTTPSLTAPTKVIVVIVTRATSMTIGSFASLPLEGRDRGRGWFSQQCESRATPTPGPSPQGG